MNMMSSIGINPSGFSKLLSTRFYTHIVHSQVEYGLAINRFTSSQLYALEEAQGICIWRTYSARGKISTKVMLHLSRLPPMSERVSILQAQFLFRSYIYLKIRYSVGYCLLFNVLEVINSISCLGPRFGRWRHPSSRNSILVYLNLPNGSFCNKTWIDASRTETSNWFLAVADLCL